MRGFATVGRRRAISKKGPRAGSEKSRCSITNRTDIMLMSKQKGKYP